MFISITSGHLLKHLRKSTIVLFNYLQPIITRRKSICCRKYFCNLAIISQLITYKPYWSSSRLHKRIWGINRKCMSQYIAMQLRRSPVIRKGVHNPVASVRCAGAAFGNKAIYAPHPQRFLAVCQCAGRESLPLYWPSIIRVQRPFCLDTIKENKINLTFSAKVIL